MNMADQNLFVGVDVGGTNVKLGIVDTQGTVRFQTSFPTRQELGPGHMVEQTGLTLEAVLRDHEAWKPHLCGVGLGTPGTMDIPRGLILEPPNMPGWRHFPIRDALAQRLNLPVTYANDANAAAFGEFWVGSGRDVASMVFFTLGTGVGGGIIIDNHLVVGANSLGGEVGHLTIDCSSQARICSCGRPGHLEAYASATALVARARDQLNANGSSLLAPLTAETLTARAIHQAAEQGDRLALHLIDETADYLARGIGAICHLLDPHAFMLGGAMTFGRRENPIGLRFLTRLQERVRDCVFPSIAENLIIDYATLGGDAGFVGAAGLAYQAHQKT